MARVVHFEIHAQDPDRAIAFYQSIFDWTFSAWGPPGMYWLVTTGPDSEPGINGGMVPRRGDAPSHGQPVTSYVCTINVTDLDSTLSQVLAGGGEMALAKMPIPGVGWLAYCKDTEDNIFGLMQNDPQAA